MLSKLLCPENYNELKSLDDGIIDEKPLSDGVLEINLKHWSFFHPVVYTMRSMSHAIYRGVSNSDYALVPSLFRYNYLQEYVKSKEYDKAIDVIERCFNHFKNAIRGRRGMNAKHELTTYEVWSLGRHYGLPTPLLDWTYSPYVAFFFAFAEDNGCRKRSVYCLHKVKIEYYQRINKISYPKEGMSLISVEEFNSLDFYSPFTDENPRLINQGGLFTICRGVFSIEDWVKHHCITIENLFSEMHDSSKRGNWLLLKINIEASERERYKILRILNRMNINYASLFPDLSGAADYTRMQLAIKHY
jgi:hypothetical protein